MTARRINEALVRKAPQSTEALLELLFEGLDWPRPASMEIEDIPLLNWTPDELHLDPKSVARLTKIQQLPPLTAKQPFGVFILSFDGGRLPVGAVRRVVNQLVRKRRARGKAAKSLWDLNDLIFFCQSSNGVGTLHVVAFRDTDGLPVMKVISWDTRATGNRLKLIASESLPSLCWPETGTLDTNEWREKWTGAFTTGFREGIKSAAALAARMADVAKEVRDEVVALYEIETAEGPLRQLFHDVKKSLRADLTPVGFADMYAQTMVYGLLTARITHPEDFEAVALNSVLKFENPFLDALYSSFRRRGDQAFDVDDFGLHDLAEILAKANLDQVLADFGVAERKDDPVVFFYEEFLDRYDPKQRKELGAYYTPIPIVRFMVRSVDRIIKTEFGLPLGVADQTTWGEYAGRFGVSVPDGLNSRDKVIRVIDPATGTGTFLLEWLRQADANLRAAGDFTASAMKAVVDQMDAFEISLSSYAVAHLKTSLELDPRIRSEVQMGIRLADSLAGHSPNQMALFEDDPIALEAHLAEQVKFDAGHTVVIGNPPYRRCRKEELGQLVLVGQEGREPLFDDYLRDAVRFAQKGHLPNIYNLYVAFSRIASWKALEQTESGPGVVAFIAPSSWLEGPAFLGMRRHLRTVSHKLIVIDLGGDTDLDPEDENVFPITTPVAIFFAYRSVNCVDEGELASVAYLRVRGSRTTKLDLLADLDPLSLPSTVDLDGHGSLKVRNVESSWNSYPLILDLFPMSLPGCKVGRTWPIGPSPTTLTARWYALLSEKRKDRQAAMFRPDTSGRTIHARPGGATSLSETKPDTPPIVRYQYRAFDRQWFINDVRVASRYRKELWDLRFDGQVFMVTRPTHPMSSGPGAYVSTMVPDLDSFRGSYGGKDVLPLYRDARGTPSIPSEISMAIADLLGLSAEDSDLVSAESVFAYCYAVLAGTDYTVRFRRELETPGPRIPFTRNRELFVDMCKYGEELIWLHTFGERCRSKDRGEFKPASSIRWKKRPSRLPQDSKDFSYDPETEVISVADGQLLGVSRGAWDFEISGMQVIKKWLAYRTEKGAGKSASSDSPLDQMRPEAWEPEWSEELREISFVLSETERLRPRGVELLDLVIAGEMVQAVQLPRPPEASRRPPSSASTVEMFDGQD
jgi:hypothetical protein